MRLHYNPRKWHYVPDDPSLTWGAADDRARLWRSPTYALRVDTKAAETPPEPLNGVWAAVLEFCDLRSTLALSTTVRSLRALAANVAAVDAARHEGFAYCSKNCTEHEAEDYRSGDPAESVGAELARRAVASLAGPPDVVVVLAARPWRLQLPELRAAVRRRLPPTCCALCTIAGALRVDGIIGHGVALLALRLPRPCADPGRVAVAAVLRRTEQYLVRGAGPSPDALDLVALVDGFGVVGSKPRSEGAFSGLMRWLRAGGSAEGDDDGVNAIC